MQKNLVARFDDMYVELTPRFVNAIIELMKAECEMLGNADEFRNGDWYYGRCHISNLSTANCLELTYGGKDDIPEDGLGRFGIIVEPETGV